MNIEQTKWGTEPLLELSVPSFDCYPLVASAGAQSPVKPQKPGHAAGHRNRGSSKGRPATFPITTNLITYIMNA